MRYEYQDQDLPRRIVININENATQEEIAQAVNKKKKQISEAQLYLDDYDKKTNIGTRKSTTSRRPVRFEKLYGEDGLQGFFSKALGLEEVDDFDITEGLGYSDRVKLSFLPTETDKVRFLQDKFGQDNVGAVPFKGESRLVFRNPVDGKFRLVDEYGSSASDFFADTASGVLPTASAVGVFAAPFTGGLSLLPTATISAGVYGITGGVQDAIARGISDPVDLQGGEILKRRSIEALQNFAIDYALLGSGRVLGSLVPKEAKTLLAQELGSLRQQGYSIPPQMTASAKDRLTTAREVATSRPTGDLAINVFETNREVASKKIENLFRGDANTIKDTYNEFINNTRQSYNRIKDSLEENVRKKDLIEGRKLNTTESQILKRITENTDAKLQADLSKITRLDDQGFDIFTSGKQLQEKLFELSYQIERKKSALYKNAENLMSGTRVKLGDISRSLKQTLKKIDDPNLSDSILTSLRPIGTKGMLLRSIDDIPNQDITSISYGQLDSIIKKIDDKLPYNPEGRLDLSDENVLALQTLRSSLDRLRSSTISDAGGAEAKRAYREANDYFTNTVLPFRQNFSKDIMLQDGQNLNKIFKQLDNLESGRRKTAPKLKFAPNAPTVFNRFIKDPSELSKLLDTIGNNPAIIQNLRKKWLETKGVQANQPIKSFSIKSEDKKIIELLWGKKKVKDFEIVNDALKNRDGVIKFETNKLFKALSDPFEAKKASDLRQLVDDELRLTRQKEAFDRDLLKLVIDGKSPLPSDVRGFADIILGFDGFSKISRDNVAQLVQAIGGRDSLSGLELKEALYESILKRASDPSLNVQSIVKGRKGKNPEVVALWDGKEFKKLLDQNEKVLRIVWGDEIFEQTKFHNKVFNDFRIDKITPSDANEINMGTAASPASGSISGFFTGIPEAIKSRYISAIWGAGGFNFNRPMVELAKQSVNARNFVGKTLENNMRAIFTSRVGQASLLRSTESDPVFSEFLSNEYMRYLNETDAENIPPVPMQ